VRAFCYTTTVLSIILVSGCSGERNRNFSDDNRSDRQTSDSGDVGEDGGPDQDAGKILKTCGNDKIDPGEICDGTDLGVARCVSSGTGGLKCSENCKEFDVSMCLDIADAGRTDTGIFMRDAGRDTGIIDIDDSGMDNSRTLVTGGCARSTGSSCQSDLDCTTGGCGEELCYNPSYGTVATACDCVSPSHLSCGCVNGKCGWWQ
jgi:hypothetical protein